MASPSSGPAWNANSAYAPDGTAEHRPRTASEIGMGANSPRELLRRLSTIDPSLGPDQIITTNPQEAYQELRLSGGLISAAFCMPHRARLKKDGKWDLTSRRGTSALFDSLSFLSSNDSPWNHTLVGWTGEIETDAETVSSPQPEPIDLATPSVCPVPISTPPAPACDPVTVTALDRARLERQLVHDDGGKVIPVWLHDDYTNTNDSYVLKDQRRWRRYAEHELYTLFHYKQHEPTDGRAERFSWADYHRLNVLFADRICEIYKPGDIIWIHDYHLLLLPNMLRQRIPNCYIGFFLHIPFPSSEFLRCLSRRKEILEGMLGANMIGFQSFSYSRHFASCCTRILHFESSVAGVDAYGAHVAVDVFPIGINAAATRRAAFNDPTVDKKVAALQKLYAGKKIIVGRDRLDSVRGVAQKLQSFEIFLQRYPQWQGKVVLIQVTSPTSVEEEKEDAQNKIANKISDLVSRINGTYGSLSFSPVQHHPQYISKEEYFALLRVADVGLITSVRDGMNTTSLEYVICQKDHDGPLILSEFSGTAGSLGNAIHINPWDTSGTARAINDALLMSPEAKAEQHAQLYRRVTTNTVQAWATYFLQRLMTNLTSHGQSVATPVLDKTLLLSQYRQAKKRLFMFDYDGTLTPIVRDPQSAIPSDRVLRTLKTLAADKRNAVWIISGRDQAFLDEWMGDIPELGLSAEHGSFIRHPLSDEWENITAKTDMSWQDDVMQVFQHYTEKTQGSFIERKKVALTWHYRRSDPEFGAWQARECHKQLDATVAKKWDVEVMPGKANLEVRPTFVNKGEIAKRLVSGYMSSSDARPASPPATSSGNTNSYFNPAALLSPTTTSTSKALPPTSTPGNKTSNLPPAPAPSMLFPDFVFCLGDDFTDEDMFRALNNSRLPPATVFSCTVGASSKQTLARWHLLEPSDVISTLALLNGAVDDGVVGNVAHVDGVVPERR